MMRQKFSKNYDSEMAEKCRRALEKSYGTDIPMPKCIVKKVNSQRLKFFEAEKCSRTDYLKRSNVLKMGISLMLRRFER